MLTRYFHRLSEFAEKSGVRDGIPWLAAKLEMGCLNWYTAMYSGLLLKRILWICNSGLVERPASRAGITTALQLGKAEVLRSFRNLLSQVNPEHCSTNLLKDRGVEKGSSQHAAILGWKRSSSSSWRSQSTRSRPLGRSMTSSSPAPACSRRVWSSGKCWQATRLLLWLRKGGIFVEHAPRSALLDHRGKLARMPASVYGAYDCSVCYDRCEALEKIWNGLSFSRAMFGTLSEEKSSVHSPFECNDAILNWNWCGA